MTRTVIFQWFACMLPGTEAARTMRGNRLQRAVRKCLRIALLRLPALLANPLGHRRLTQVLLSPRIENLTLRHPKLAYKYLDDNYLARHMPTRTRLAILTHHYAFVGTRLRGGFLDHVFAERVMLWRDAADGHRFGITLAFPRSPHHPDRFADQEGDLALAFTMDDVPLYVLCFTVAPGNVMNLDRRDILFVGRLQGADGRFEQIRQATRLLHDISPRDILLAALQGLAAAIGVDTIAGVSNAEQLAKSRGRDVESVLFDYDSFWMALQAQRTIDNLFVLPLPIPEKPIETIAQKHRARTLRKRRYKESVSATVRDEFRSRHLAAGRGASPAHESASDDCLAT